MSRIVQFAVATAMRLDEICRVEWRDLDVDHRMLLIRDRKDPRNKTGNDQRIPLFAATGFDAWVLITAQARHLGKATGSIFPYNSRSVGTVFRRACAQVGVKDLHFHDLRHEAIRLRPEHPTYLGLADAEFWKAPDAVPRPQATKDYAKLLRRMARLPETPGEVAAVAQLFPDSVDVLTGANATEAALYDLSREGRQREKTILHFATHGAVYQGKEGPVSGAVGACGGRLRPQLPARAVVRAGPGWRPDSGRSR